MRTLVLGRTSARVTEVVATLRADGFEAEGVSTDEDARRLLESEGFGVLVIGGEWSRALAQRSRSSRLSTGCGQ
ncbi:hypothetical protein [Streptomyces sp. A1277]|uniref:hypothetical protein n=1 Tax=Streptomyces sp. A1277 TaxID=2563103 RepID=UPI001F102D27|nr:hypothetical protein [Streptomyces sp. A1277]